jgi:hypothetical protein
MTVREINYASHDEPMLGGDNIKQSQFQPRSHSNEELDNRVTTTATITTES